MKKKIAQWCVITMVAASAIFAATNPMVGGHEMFPTKNNRGERGQFRRSRHGGGGSEAFLSPGGTTITKKHEFA